jgi:hypothetical protein
VEVYLLLGSLTVFLGGFLPGAIAFFLGYGTTEGGPAMILGNSAAMFTFLVFLRVGKRRGWWTGT